MLVKIVPHLGNLAIHEPAAFQPQICREMLYNWLFDRPFAGYDPQQPLKQRNGNGNGTSNAGLQKG